jgi:type I restriction enzyme S subunit
MTELPKGWEWSTVGALGNYINGRGFKRTDWSTTGRPIIRIQNLTSSGPGFNYFDGPLDARYVVPTGSLLVSWAATLGVYRWGGPEGALNQHIFKVLSFVNEDFHRYLLDHALDLMREHVHGSGMVHITRGRFDSTPVPVPPLAEQERIVAAIEEAFSKLDAGEAGLRRLRHLLKRMRDAVLVAAVIGRLVPQDPVDTPAGKLLADCGADSMTSEGLPVVPPHWRWVRLGSVADVVGGVTKDMKLQADPSFVSRPYLRVANVQRGYLDLADIAQIRVASEKAERLTLQAGDVLFNEGGDRDKLGRGWVWEGQISGCIHQNHVFRARFPRGWQPKLVSWWGNSFGKDWFEGRAKQTTNLASLNLTTLRSFPIPVPPIQEQERIVAEVERQFTFLDACEKAVDAGLARAAALRRSVLKAAFEGKLVPQDPTDEPASVLLDRIRAERVAAPKSNVRRARTAS